MRESDVFKLKHHNISLQRAFAEHCSGKGILHFLLALASGSVPNLTPIQTCVNNLKLFSF